MKKILAILLCFAIMVPVMATVASAAQSTAIVQGGLEGDGEVDGREDDKEDEPTEPVDPNSSAADGNIWAFFINLFSGVNWVSIFTTLLSSFNTLLKMFGSFGGTTTPVA